MSLKEQIYKIFTLTVIIFGLGAGVFAQDITDEVIPKQYPKKYTRSYIKQITPGYKCVGKDEIFYVALDMLKDTKGMFSRMQF